ncbi:MAG: RnfABCDGE type electron transport complex subunit D [Bacillota bacterium]|nr:RnfABCDGE type electron transport complex subunit D [Bacillota bacterium]
MENKVLATSSPHIRSKENTTNVMLDVIIALLPAVIASIYYFGFDSIKLTSIAVISAVATEAIIQKLLKKEVTIKDLSAVVTGILLAFNLPPSAPWWIPLIGSVFAIAVAKQVFGGLGHNFINPALAARAMLLASWPTRMLGWENPAGVDAVSAATPLQIIKGAEGNLQPLTDLIFGRIPGSLGETSAILLIIGGLYLLYRGVISWKIPVSYIGTVAVIAYIYEGSLLLVGYHVFGGGLLLGAIFMATDYASSPVTSKGKIVFGIGAGIFTMLIRIFGAIPEGVSYSILLMNIATPIIERYTAPKVFGGAKNDKK